MKKRVHRNDKKNYLETLKMCPGLLYFPLLTIINCPRSVQFPLLLLYEENVAEVAQGVTQPLLEKAAYIKCRAR